MNALEHLADHTLLVADSSRLEDLEEFSGLFGVTTNPTLVMQALDSSNSFDNLLYEAMRMVDEKKDSSKDNPVASDCLLAMIGAELYRLFGVQVSLEVDARLAHDTEATITRAESIAALCAEFSMPADKLLVKIAATDAGIAAVEQLERLGIHCNVTLLFSVQQAAAAADAGAWLVSPFVGRVSDWYAKNKPGHKGECPGVQLVREIQGYMRQFSYETRVMGASFRTSKQVLSLCGTDLLTISPKLLRELSMLEDAPDPYTTGMSHDSIDIKPGGLANALKKDPMAKDLLKDGIDRFVADQLRLDKLLQEQGKRG